MIDSIGRPAGWRKVALELRRRLSGASSERSRFSSQPQTYTKSTSVYVSVVHRRYRRLFASQMGLLFFLPLTTRVVKSARSQLAPSASRPASSGRRSPTLREAGARVAPPGGEIGEASGESDEG